MTATTDVDLTLNDPRVGLPDGMVGADADADAAVCLLAGYSLSGPLRIIFKTFIKIINNSKVPQRNVIVYF